MPKKVRSARGVMVDFDLIAIKKQIAERPATNDVRARQDFIEKKLRRRLKKAAKESKADVVKSVEVEPSLTAAPSEALASVVPEVQPVPAPKKTLQKARSK
jgi:hypothetical protein